jgi:hypothetical protein
MTYACPAWEFEAETHVLKFLRLQNRVIRTNGNFPRRTQVPIRIQISKFRSFMMTYQNYAEDKQKYLKIMKMKMFVILDKTKLQTGNIRGLNLAADV